MANETVVRISADATGYTSALERAKRSANDFTASQEAASARTVAAQKAIEEATSNASRASVRQINAFMQSLAKKAETAGKTRAELLAMQAATLGVSASAQQYVKQIADAGRHTEEFNLKTASARRELLVLAHEASQGNWKNFGGSLLVLGERTDALGLAFSGAGLAASALLAGVAAIATAAIKGAEDVKQFNAALDTTGNYAGLTRESFELMAESLASSTQAPLGRVNDVLLELAKSGRYSSEEMKGLGNVIARTAEVSGRTLQEISKDYLTLAKNPSRWAAEHNESMHFMDVATYEHIHVLQRAGREHEALQAVIDAAAKQVERSSERHVTTASKAWRQLSAEVEKFWAKLKQGLSEGPSLQDRVDTLVAEKHDLRGHSFTSGRMAEIDRQIDRLRRQQEAEEQAAKREADIARKQQEGLEARLRVDKLRENVKTNSERRSEALTQLNKDRAAILAGGGHLSDQEFNRLASNINERYQDRRHVEGVKLSVAERYLARFREQHAEMLAQLASGENSTGAERALAKFNEQIADLKRRSGKRDEAGMLAREREIRTQLQLNVGLEKEIRFREKLRMLDGHSAALRDRVEEYQTRTRAAYDDKISYGEDAQASKRLAEVRAIKAEYQRWQDELRKGSSKDVLDSQEYQKAAAQINAALEKSLADHEAYYSALEAKQADWKNGVKSAIAGYLESVKDMAGQTRQAVTQLFHGMESALEKFVTNGKVDFREFAASVLADLARIAFHFASAQIFKSILTAPGLPSLFSSGGLLPHFASGGAIYGSGSATSDSIPAMLSNGEFVVNAASTKKHRELLEAINSDRLTAFSGGGMAGGAAHAGGAISSNVHLEVHQNGGGLDKRDLHDLQTFVKAFVDQRLTQRMRGQGGSAYQQSLGMI
ncbi:phage tail tape measure protein [Paraburkholderia azotifigens]|uniref:phage tail tape measure protein n=1 Tax=Paraburkholderia azotifigens TaxID=2057004 RepID=UPI003174714A